MHTKAQDPSSPRAHCIFQQKAQYMASKAVFSFLYFLKIKISKIYVRFEIFQKYTPVALGRQALSVNFFFKIRNEVPGKKSPVAGDRGTPYKRADPPLPSSFEPENSTKNSEKREE